jgi:IS605 OrfB family transposase
MKTNENWKLLPAKVSNQVWKQVSNSWNLWFKALDSYKKNPSKFTGKPKMPKYNKSMNIVVYEKGAIGTRKLPDNHVRLSKTNIILDRSKLKEPIKQIKIIPKKNKFIIIAIYESKLQQVQLNKTNLAGLDLGLNNICSIATNQSQIENILVNGRYIKSINWKWNKQVSRLKSQLPRNIHSSNKIFNLTTKRNNVIQTELHKISRKIVSWLVNNDIGTLIIGKNQQWKNNISIGKRNNQNFTQIPHTKLIELIKYKFEELGGMVKITEESYTSKASALDLDKLPKYKKGKKLNQTFSGKRIKRGLYKTSTGEIINADINGALNIMRKVIGNSIDDLISDKQFIHNCRTPVFI